jgi:hypothetical protein
MHLKTLRGLDADFILGSKFERNLPAPDLPRESSLARVLAIVADFPQAPTSEQVRNL